jgi:ribosomal protein S18 acetylase RimI-like enzyme
MSKFNIRKYQPKDFIPIEDIVYRTGFKGEDMTGLSFIDDKRLFFLISIFYYPKYEPEHCFVAVDAHTDKVVGFICGTPNTNQQETKYEKLIPWRIFLRTLGYTIWRYPKSFMNLLKLNKARPDIGPSEFEEILAVYPAHLHINLLPEAQRQGLGSRLMAAFLDHLQFLDVPGVHLQTSSYNKKAIPFYSKLEFILVNKANMDHFLFDDLKLLTFVKKIGPKPD